MLFPNSIQIPLALLTLLLPLTSSSSCRRGCEIALASYYLPLSLDLNLTYISNLFSQSVSEIRLPNPEITNPDYIPSDSYLNISFPCNCLSNPEFLGNYFNYTALQGDTYSSIATDVYMNLTTAEELEKVNGAVGNGGLRAGAGIRIAVRCFCGDAGVSKRFGLFATYPLKVGDSMKSVAAEFGFVDLGLLQEYNAGVDFGSGRGIVFVPTTDANGIYPRFQSSNGGLSGGAIAGICVVLVVVILVATCIFYLFYKKKKEKKASLLQNTNGDFSVQSGMELVAQPCSGSELDNLNLEKSVEFSYQELSVATDSFSMTNKIGEGGFGAVYYAELRGERAAIKKMDMQASNEFLAEVKVLTHVHHLNLVRLIGYCIEEALFLVYEYIDNGNLSQRLRGSGVDPLTWSVRLQIALDSARGLEYIHEHTVPVYIHRDIKSANILIDRNFRAKVADFGLTKLTDIGNVSLPTRLVGTFGYMPPEYAQYGEVSPKIDVFAFGVVLYELISAKEAIVKTDDSAVAKGLVSLFEASLNQPDPVEHLKKLVDPNIGDNYPIDSVFKLAQLAKSCTDENSSKRPTMRSVVVALMALSSSIGDWDIGNFYGNQALVNLMSGR